MRPLIEDFPSQFKRKPKIEALCACFDRQFAEIEQCFQKLLILLDIEKAEGEQLDRDRGHRRSLPCGGWPARSAGRRHRL